MKLLATSDETKWYAMLCETIIRIANDSIPDKCPCCEKKLVLTKELVSTPQTTLFEMEQTIKKAAMDEKISESLNLLKPTPVNLIKVTKIYGFDDFGNENRCDYYYCACGAKWRSCHYSIPNQYEIKGLLNGDDDLNKLEKLARQYVIEDE